VILTIDLLKRKLAHWLLLSWKHSQQTIFGFMCLFSL